MKLRQMKPTITFCRCSQAAETSWLSHDPQTVNKPPSEDDNKPHWGTCTWKANTYSLWRGAKGSIICFPCSQKFMSDGLATGSYPLPARFLPSAQSGRAELGIAAHLLFSYT